MRASVIAYWAAKAGSSAAEYEDAWRVVPGAGDEVPGERAGVAVADGATESLLARQWARMTADGFASAPGAARDAHSFAETAIGLSARWPGVVGSYVAEREHAGRPLRWYERPGIAKGAFATVLTLQVDIGSAATAAPGAQPGAGPLPAAGALPVIGRWHSAALGDTCLFHVRGGRLDVAYPLGASADFDTSPALLGSCDTDPEVIVAHVRLAGGSVAEGDDFFVCTDALAAWFLTRAEEGGRPWETLRDLTGGDGFAELVSLARRTGDLRNDDVTLVHVDIW
jgi:hypothetical protein